MRVAAVRQFCVLDETGKAPIKTAMNQLQFSGRFLKLEHAIADLAESESIQPGHLAEALQYRPRLMLG